jgi:hypothetical protein
MLWSKMKEAANSAPLGRGFGGVDLGSTFMTYDLRSCARHGPEVTQAVEICPFKSSTIRQCAAPLSCRTV